MGELYTTPQASEITGIPEGTIRSWLSRYVGLFEVGKHLIIEESGRKLWTEEGIKLLRERNTKPAAETATSNDAKTVEHNSAQFLLDAVEHDAQQLAVYYWQMLPVRTLAHIRRMGTQPSIEERDIVQNAVVAAAQVGILHLLPAAERKLLT